MKSIHSLTLALLLAASGYAATTTITDTVYDVDGSLANGSLVARLSQACTGPSKRFVARTGKRVRIVAGALSIDLERNDTCTPANTTYSVKFTLRHGKWEETWSIEASGPLARADVITDTTVGPSTSVRIAQLSGGTTKGDVIAHNGTIFARLGVGSNGSILFADSTEALGLKWGDLYWDKTNLIVQGGGTTASFPGWKRSTVGWEARLANDSALTWVRASFYYINTNGTLQYSAGDAAVRLATTTAEDILLETADASPISFAPNGTIYWRVSGTGVLEDQNSGAIDFASAATTAPVKAGTSPPGTCSPPEMFIDTDAGAANQLLVCTSANTWTDQ